ncbi:MAG TPA: MBL fold metallo-hydrolase [Longimicrobiales bacterium]|nr:MBL fold metallo-hydrolase [Longimicrobiales bacterium]
MPTSRREFLAASTAAAIAAAIGRPARAFGGWQQVPPPAFTAIRRNVGFFTMRGGTIGYLVNPGGVVAVDSQFPAEATAFLEGVKQQSGGRGVDVLINTHHHGDHTGGNISFRGATKSVVAHEMAAEHMRLPPGGEPPEDQLFPDTTFTDSWSADVGDEHVVARHYGRAHTSGDVVITFERANVAHMGDLMFNRRHPVVDRAAGATLRNWMEVLVRAADDHAADTVYIFGHANAELPVTGSRDDLMVLRDYFDALLTFVDAQVKAGRSRDEILAMRDPLPGFETFGPFGRQHARDPLTCAYEEITEE